MKKSSQMVSEMLAWEEGLLGEHEEILLFQELISLDIIKYLDESYKENADLLVEVGLVNNPKQQKVS